MSQEHYILDRVRSELKFWEQATLSKIAQQGTLSDEDLLELRNFFLQDAGLARVPADRPKLAVPPEAPTTPESCRLSRIFNVKRVNALAEGQQIQFGPQLTLIFGENGAGKSGYARVLGAAGFARGKRSVLPNVRGTEQSGQPTAEIEISCGVGTKTVNWTAGERCAELAGIHLFDNDSLSAHLSDANSLSYTPGRLSLLTRLADATDRVRETIRRTIADLEMPPNFAALFDGESETKELISQLTTKTDYELLQKRSQLTDDEQARVAALETEISRLRLLDVN